MDVLLILAIYLLIVNLAGFAAMGIDKNRARRKAWRIPESTLFLLAPAWGATQAHGGLLPPPGISTHAPAWGATSMRTLKNRYYTISTHAPL